MMDVTTYAGVDLKEEEDLIGTLGSSGPLPPSNPLGVDRSKMQNFMNFKLLKEFIGRIGG
jgi:hypothetical protein